MILLPETSWEVRDTQIKGRGLFTLAPIKQGTVIGDYTGTVMHTIDALKEDDTNFYLMYYSDRASIYPEDINAPGLHTVNHSCVPNCWMYLYRGHTLFFAVRDIEAGEEITVHYLLAPDPNCIPCSHVCKCGAEKCTGTMHLSVEKYQEWEGVEKWMRNQTKPVPIRYGHVLKPLTSYPPTVALP